MSLRVTLAPGHISQESRINIITAQRVHFFSSLDISFLPFSETTSQTNESAIKIAKLSKAKERC